MKMDEKQYMSYYTIWDGTPIQATPEECELKEKIFSYESWFEDMVFRQGSSTHDLIRAKVKSEGSDQWDEWIMDLPEELEYFTYTWFLFKIESLGEYNSGQYNHQEQTITISPEALEDDTVILHELIHLHESVINELPMYFHDMVYWSLYRDLKEKIPELDEIITDHAHLLNGSEIYKTGGLHDILFLLKSFDLDIRMNVSLGTVFGYDKENDFGSYKYISDTIKTP